jgi:hypothetical protein
VFVSAQAVEVNATQAFDSEQRTVYAKDGVHYTASGNRLVAEAPLPAISRSACGG